MGTKKAAKAVVLMVCVAAISTLAACSAPAPELKNVYPERGFTTVVDGKCDPQVASTDLTIGGTVSTNGTNIKATTVDEDVIVSFEPSNTFVSDAVVNGSVPVTILDKDNLSFGYADFGTITSITLCGGGM